MSNLQLWSTLVGVVMPVLISIVNQPQWKPWVRQSVAVVSSVVAAAITCEMAGQLSAADLASSVITVLTATISTYHLFWKPTKIAPTVEVKTTRGVEG